MCTIQQGRVIAHFLDVRCLRSRTDSIPVDDVIMAIIVLVKWRKIKAIDDLVLRMNYVLLKSLFVFQSDDPQQNVNSFLTSIFNTVIYALSHDTFLLFLHGSSILP